MTHPIAEAFTQAAELVAADANRRGNCLHFQAGLEIVYVGDIHGHRQNLAKVIRWADLGFSAERRLVLQEIIHGGPADPAGNDRSFEVLLRAARLKIAYPQQVFFLMGNHDLAQFAGGEIAKEGRGSASPSRRAWTTPSPPRPARCGPPSMTSSGLCPWRRDVRTAS